MAISNVKTLSEMSAAKLKEMAENTAVYTDFLKFQGRVFKQNATVALEFFTQKPDVTFIANARQWAAAGYKIKDGGEAIHFTDENGIKNDLFDFSQVEGNIAPRLWTINSDNAREFKSALGIADDTPIIKAVIEQTVKNSQVTDCMEVLGVPPGVFERFKKSYVGTVQAIIAGRFEVGGNKFNVNPDVELFQALDDNRKMHFLAMVSDTARNSLLSVEKIANEITIKNLQERNEKNEKNDVSTVGSTDTGAAEINTGEPTAGNTARGIREQADSVENDNQGQREVLGNSVGERENDETVSRIQAKGSVGNSDLVQVQSDVGILQHEPHRNGSIDGGRTYRELRNEVDRVDESELSPLSSGNADEAHLSDSGEVGGRNGMELSGVIGHTVHESQSPPEDVRGNSSVGEDESVLHGRSNDAGESVDSAHSGLAKLNNALNNDEPSADKQAGVSSLPKTHGHTRKKADPNQISLFDIFDEADEIPIVEQETKEIAKPVEITADAQIITDELMRGSHFQNGKFRIEEFAKVELAKEKPDMATFAKFLQNEYGTGGHSGDEVVKAVDYDSKGILIRLRDERRIELTWNNVAKQIAELIKKDEYITQNDIKEAFHYADRVLKDYSREPNSSDKFYVEKAEEFIAKNSHRRPPEVEVTSPAEPSVIMEPQYAVGDKVKLEDNKTFIITQISDISGEVQLRAPTLLYPIFRAESKENFEWMLEMYGNEKFFVPATPKPETPYDRYLKIKEQYPDSLVFMQLGDFYEAFGEDAEKICSIRDFTLTSRNEVPMCGIPTHTIEKNVESLMTDGYEVVAVNADGEVISTADAVHKREGKKRGWELDSEPETPPTPQVKFLYEGSKLSEGIKTAHYLVYHDDTIKSHNGAFLSHEVLAQIKEKSDNYVFYADALALSQEFMEQHNISFRKLPRDWGIIDTAARIMINEIQPQHEKYWEESNEVREFADELNPPEKKYDLGYGNLGNGTTVYNKLEEINGDFRTVAHISDEYEGGVKFYEDVPEDVRERIERAAHRLNISPPTEQEIDEHLANIAPAIELNPELVSEYGAETALQLQKAFDESRQAGYESNIIKQRKIKRALYDVLRNEPEVEKAFTMLTGIEAAVQEDEPEIIDTEPETSNNLPEIKYADSPQDKFWDNWSALRELKRIEGAVKFGRDPYDSKYNARENSEARLSKYSGWGGLPDVFDNSKHDWNRQRTQLKEVLTEDEYEAARVTTLNAHYTPQIIIDAMYEAIKNMDLPRNARILEPSCGTGNFLRRLPSQFSEAEVTGVEIDSITAHIAKFLNPDARIIESGFEVAGLDNNDFDLVCGNVPFGDYQLLDPDYAKNWLIHDAFFRKALDKVAPRGIVAFVTSSGTMDKVNPRVREYLAKQAELVGAIRLPNNAFKDAGTKVTADIVFLQKRKTPLEPYEESPDWCYTVPNADGLKINSYFVKNPQMILGKMEQTTHFDMLTCKPFENADLKQQLAQAIGNLNAKITVEKRDKAAKEREGLVDADGSIKNFTFGELDGEFFYRTGDKMKKITPAPQLKALCNLRDWMRELLNKQKRDIPDDMLISSRMELNHHYDNYRKKYGIINSAASKKIFGDDSDYPLLQGLEVHNEKTNEWEKADIFTKRTVNAVAEVTGAESVEEALQIALDRRGKPDIEFMAELLEREQSEVCAELLEKELCFRDPEKQLPDSPYSGIIERSEYLSGNVRRKLEIAEMNMLTHVDPQTGKLDGSDYKRNVEALQKVIPEDIKAENIAVRMGVPWIESEDYTEFLRELAGRNNYSSNGEVTYSPVTGEFEVSGAKKRDKSGLNINEHTKYGTSDFSLYALAEKSLNQRQIVVKVEKRHPTEPDKTVMKTDHKATKMALEKARLIKDEFKKWIFADDDRRNKYERKYNDIFNCLVGREYDGSKLTFPGMASMVGSKDFIMRDHQKNAVARTTLGGNSLIAHVVGAGKSAVIFATVMRKKELGMINKACVVVPKPLTEQIAKEWRNLYPEARLLTVSNEDLSSEAKRKVFTAKVATGSYDAVILSREQFEKIPMSRESRIAFMRKELDQVVDMLRERRRENRGRGDPSTKQLELAKKRMEARISKLTDSKSAAKAKDDLLEFEHLGFDYLVADEAHAYKNGFVMTKMTNVAGVTTRESGRAADMQMKCDYFNEQLGDGHILLCTGTPVSNSITELFVMTRYLRPDLLRQAGIERFDDWAATFGNVTTQLEQTAYDTYKLKTRFSEFANLPELMAFYKEFADIKSAAKLDLPRPALKNGKNTIVNVPATPEQKAYVKELGERAEVINQGNVHPTEDNFLKITGEARLIGLGNQAVKAMYARSDRELPPEFVDGQKNGKVDACVEKVFERWEETADVKGVQLVFSDVAVNDDNNNFSAYKYIREELIAKGIPAEQIIFAPKSDEKNREEIFKKINSGEYRVVIASTETLGTGCNIQNKLVALHHLDVPWKPSALEQREGRILRQGNENPEVEIFNYVTTSTLDSYLYSTVTNKARFIAQILDNDSPARVCADVDETVLTYAEIQAVAAGKKEIRQRIETANEIAELNMLRREWGRERASMREQLEVLPTRLETAKGNLERIQADKVNAEKVAAMEELPFDNKRLYAEIKKAFINLKNGDSSPIVIGTIGGFTISVQALEIGKGCLLDKYQSGIDVKITIKGESTYSFEPGRSENDNNAVRLKNVFTSIIPKREENIANDVEQYTANIEQAKAQIDVPFEYEEKIIELEKLLAELDAKLSGAEQQQDVIADEDDLEKSEVIANGETKEQKAEREEIYSVDHNDHQPVPNSDDDEPETPRRGRVA
jgi:N12 class adenine-specific DNA methylase